MHLDLNSDMESNFNTDGRTDGTKNITRSDSANRSNARARIDEMTAVSVRELLSEADPTAPITRDDVRLLAHLLRQRESRHDPERAGRTIAQIIDGLLEGLEMEPGRRWPVIRSGEREPIPWVLRASIPTRDDYTCKACGWHDTEGFELDHCIPWSAGGPDDSDNLRTLCRRCNQSRSNFIDYAHATTLLPTTYWCIDCWTYEDHQTRRLWKDGTDLNGAPWVAREEAGGPMVLAYCAHCHYISTTDVYFAGQMGRDLLANATRYVRPVES